MKLTKQMGAKTSQTDGVTVEPSEQRLRTVITTLGIVVGPVLLLLLYYKVMFVGLTNPDAMDYAQLGRNLHAGRGFVTSILRPLALPPGSEAISALRQPDVTHGPLFPFLLALAFGAGSAQDRVAAAVSGLFYLLTIPVAYLLGARVFGRTVGLLTAAVVAVSPLFLEYAVAGLPITLYTFLVTSLLLMVYNLAAHARDRAGAADYRLPKGPLFTAGLLTGLLYLTDPMFFWVIPVSAAAVILLSRKQRPLAAVWYAGPLLIPVVPAMLRNAALTGNPVFGLRGQELWMHTTAYPGFEAYRMVSGDLAPGAHLLNAVGMKMFRHLSEVMEVFPQITAVWILVFLIPSFLFRFTDGAANALRRTMMFCLLALFIGCLFFRVDMPLFVSLVPAMLVFALGFLAHIVQQAQLSRPGQAVLATVLAMTLLVPLASQLTWKTKAKPSPHMSSALALGQHTDRDEVSLSDQPWLVAWYADRPSLWLPKNDGRVKELTARMDKARWLFLTEQTRGMSGDWPAVYNAFVQWNVAYAQARQLAKQDPKVKVPPSVTISGRATPLLESLNGFTAIEPMEDGSLATVIAAKPLGKASASAAPRAQRIARSGRP
jgi:hypothetical protein